MRHINVQEQIKNYEDTLTFVMNAQELRALPLKTVMTSLNILERNNQTLDFYFEFSKDIQEFIQTNQNLFLELKKEENYQFQQWSEVYFNYMTGPQYQAANCVLNYVQRVYDKENAFNYIQEITNLPKIIWKTKHTVEGYELNVKNIDELNSVVGKAIMLQTLVLLKDCLNYHYQQEHTTQHAPYKLSSNLIQKLYNEELQQYEYLEKFTGNDYFLSYMNEEAMRHQKVHSQNIANTILTLVSLNESVRVADLKLNQQTKIKP